MGSPADDAGDRVVNRVVVDKEGHTDDVHRGVDRQDEQQAVNAISIEVVEVVIGTGLNPVFVDQEKDAG